MRNIKLIIAYDGTSYLGWQKTAMGLSIEETLENILSLILQHPVALQAASRTDAGVHAHGQVVNFLTQNQNFELRRLQISLNQLLPPEIVVLEASEEALDFHPTLNCKEKEYWYFLCKGAVQMPEHRLYSWHCPKLQHLSELRQAAHFFVGKHNFSAFLQLQESVAI